MDILEPIICSPEGITLQTQDLHYLACSENSCSLLAEKSNHTKFFVSKTSAKDTVTFKNCYTNKYLGLVLHKDSFQLEAVMHKLDETCKFTISVFDGGKIALKGHNQKFLTQLKSNNTLRCSIQATSDEINNDCMFYITYGDSIKPIFQISSIHWKKIPALDNIIYSAVVLDTVSYMNGNCTTVSETLNFPCYKEIEQQTKWKQLWGCEVKHEYETKFPETDGTIKVIYENMSDTSSAIVPLPINIQPVSVIVAPKKTVIVRLILQRSEVVTLPFIATIKRFHADGTTCVLNIDGSWIGYLHKTNSEEIQICETELAIQ